MPKNHRPTKGSMAFSPRVRARRHFGRVKSWTDKGEAEVKIMGFAGWKAGMTHVLLRDTNNNSATKGQEIRQAVTVVETPPIRLLAVRGYRRDSYGLQTYGEVWWDPSELTSEFPDLARRMPLPKNTSTTEQKEKLDPAKLDEVRILVATQPSGVNAIPTKSPEVMELGLTGGKLEDKLNFGYQNLGKELSINDCFQEGRCIDAIGITKGKGFQGVVKRFGVKLLSHKNSKRRRMIGNLGDFGTRYVRKTVRQAGQVGYHQRTEYNKRILRISNPEEHEITPSGGFLNYGEVGNDYLIIKGSLPGPAKRLLRFRDPVRCKGVEKDIDLTYVSTASKQGV